tara:strand:+ start:444 stop:737 length:294 start_codon:yes stop_codon:yes gene_type:complete
MSLSAKTKKALSNKAKAAREKGKNVTASQLGRVYKRGLAAYKTGHRPGASQHQWAMARVNSVLTGGKAATVDKDIMKGKKAAGKTKAKPKAKKTKKA